VLTQLAISEHFTVNASPRKHALKVLDFVRFGRMKTELTWADHFDRWELSGFSKKDYCARHGLSYQMFFYYQRRNQELRTEIAP